LLALGQEGTYRLPVPGFWIGFIVGGLVVGYVGLKVGGGLAIARVSRIAHNDLRRRAGLRIRN
jgi:hypothetical protein